MVDKVTVALNEAAIAEALAQHYSKMGDSEMASVCTATMQQRLEDAAECDEEDNSENFDIDIV